MAERIERPAQRRWAALWIAALLGALLAGLTGCAGGGSQQLPDFPHYAPADGFLAMQERLRAYRPPPGPDAYAYTERNAAIYQDLQNQQRLSAAELEQRARLQEEALLRHRASNQQEWDALNQRRARDEAVAAQQDEERARNTANNQVLYAERYDMYRSRLERLAMEQEAMARQREQAAYQNQQRVNDEVAKLQQRQSQNLRVQGLSAAAERAPAPVAQ
jgi:hypothetical protein